MDAEEIRLYALQKPGAAESLPFGPDTLVFKADNKIFLLMGFNDEPLSVNLKCDPERAVELRENYREVILPGYHMNKKHWNTILVKSIKNNLLKELIDHSYALVAKKK